MGWQWELLRAPQRNEQWGREGKQERRQPGSISVTTAINPGVSSQSPNYGERELEMMLFLAQVTWLCVLWGLWPDP